MPTLTPFAPDDLDAVAYLIRQGFGIPRDGLLSHRALLGDHAFRVLREGGRPAGFAAVWGMDQWFGGRPVPAQGVAAVTVDPAARGGGLGAALVAGLLREAQASGQALSVLYGATLPLYARLGYARAGCAVLYGAAPATLAADGPGLIRLDSLDADRLAALRRREARAGNGLIDRTEALWTRLLKPGEPDAADLFVAEGEEGYVAVHPPGGGRLVVADVCALSRRAARAVLRFLAGYRAQVDHVVWPGGPEDPLVHLAPETGVRIDEWEEWLLRIVDVPGALAARGYPAGTAASLVLEVADPLLPANHGRFRLSVSDGRGTVERLKSPGPADLLLPVDALAPLFSGHLGPAALARMGLLTGPEAGITTAASLFAGPRPWMADRF